MNSKDRVVETLLARRVISGDQLHIAEVERQTRAAPLGRILVSLGFLSEAMLRDATAEIFDQRSVDLVNLVPDAEAIGRVPRSIAARHRLFPLSYESESNTLTLAMADPFNIVALDQIRALLGNNISLTPLLAGETDIAHAIAQFYGLELSIEGILHEIETGQIDERSLVSRQAAYHHPTIRLVDALIAEAVKQSASDIHFEPEAGFVRVRYRVDGVLHQVRSLHAKYWPAVAVRLKVMSNLNIADTRSPQDGRITLALLGRSIDFRVSVIPTVHGENIVLRILDRHGGILPLDQLGLAENALGDLRRIISRPEGLVLVTGPTGSGKTTTLYSLLNTIHSETRNIVTLEDPVEYPLPGIRQTAVNDAVRLDFASGVRALLRQDPDVILIGEIRDSETATMAVRAAMTGHQVFSTLHTNSAAGAISRLMDLGVRQETLAGNLIGIVAQRLVRRLCPLCRIEKASASSDSASLGRNGVPTWRASGCNHCNYRGYRGRFALIEVIHVNEELDALIAEGAPMRALRQCIRESGGVSLAEDGLRRIRAGETTIEELARVVDLSGMECP